MTEKPEILFDALEKQIMRLLTERDEFLLKNQHLTAENQALKAKEESHMKKLHDLVALIESISAPATPEPAKDNFSPSLAAIKPLMAQGQA